MTETVAFQGSVLSSTACELGEGPTYDPQTDTVWWFNILGRELHELSVSTGDVKVHALPFKASVLARIDGDRQLIASDQGLMIRDSRTGAFERYLELEPAHMGNRSNDGRVHPSGALWLGTMGLKAQTGAGSIYHVAKGSVTRIVTGVSIPNAVCFSPDGTAGYYTDTTVNRIMRLPLDPSTGLPTGDAALFLDTSDRPGGADGAVCDADGAIWNARWGEGAVDRYDADGRHLARYKVPAKRTTCPAFFGAGGRRMLVTTAFEGASDKERAEDPQAGFTFDLGIDVAGRLEPCFQL
ncbi:SMP-30/gluconolactonase/LRE family protein [Rhizobium sp. SAFR-030]|uniref:SMP-30/gluconolactonase/LRE family protein n=1 Tax=Rhizobium sp. SAFR-030 TaxID=3387277 RepID=UPI003F7F8710